MGYFRDLYGTRSPDFVKGALAAMKAYAIWYSGELTIGSSGSLKKEMFKVVNDMAEHPEDFIDEIERFF